MPETTPMAPLEKYYFKEIALLIVIKLVLLITLRMVFFSKPDHKPDGTQITSAHLLGASAPAASPFTSEKRSSHDQ